MSQEQLIPVLPEAPILPDPKKYVQINVKYLSNFTEYVVENSTKIRDIILNAAAKLNFRLNFGYDWANFSFFIGHQRISENREIGFYRSLLSSNEYLVFINIKMITNKPSFAPSQKGAKYGFI